jgi:hypothetical protein
LADFDLFAATLLEEAKRFLERAIDARSGLAESPNLHASIMLAFCSLEAHVNGVSDEMAQRDGLTPHEVGVLLEKDVALSDGIYAIENRLRMFRLEDRIYFLHARFGMKPDLHGEWRARLAGALRLRNQLTHPRGVPTITVAAVKQAVQAVIDTIDALYRALYDRPFPAAGRELTSNLEF